MKLRHSLCTQFLLVWGVFLIGAEIGDAAKILCVFSTPSRSHHILGEVLTDALAEHGHEITVITAFKPSKPQLYHKTILIEGLSDIMRNIFPSDKMYETHDVSFVDMLANLVLSGSRMSNRTLQDPEIQKLLRSDTKFDMVITKQFLNEALFGFAQHFGAIPVVFSTLGASTWTNSLVGNPNNPSYNPNMFLRFPTKMSYTQRMMNFLASVGEEYMHGNQIAAQNEVYKEVFGALSKTPLPDFKDVLTNISMVFINSHVALGYARPLVPNMIEVGGIHIKEGGKLPEDIQKFLDAAKDGAVFFSLGSNLRSADLPVEKRDAILKTFGKLKQRVLWKWEDANLPGKPENVMISPWLPQQSILAHPKVQCFITHGGMLSTTEAVYYGVPVIGIPAYGDQHMNMAQAEAGGYGVTLELKDLNEQTLSDALATILQPSYYENVKKLSVVFRDNPQKPIDKAIYNVEYVLRHKGAPFLRSPSLHLTTLQSSLVDVVAGLLAVVFTVLGVLYLIMRTIYRKFTKKQITEKKKKN